MIKKLVLSVILLCLLAIGTVPASAAGGITITGGSAKAEYPATLKFNISAQSSVNIVDIRLHYAVEAVRFAKVTSEAFVNFTPATNINASWTWDMIRTGGLPPGTTVNYWWTLTDASGARIDTQMQKVLFDDLRFSWQTLTQGMVTIYWYNGDKTFAGELMTTAQSAIDKLAKDTGAAPNRPLKIYIYKNAQDLQGAIINPQEWTGGVTYAEYGIIAIGISPSNLEWGKRAMSHELTHLVIHQVVLNPYNDIPTWLDEGLAVRNEGPTDPSYTSMIQSSVSKNQLISVRSLASPFSALPNLAVLSYAESGSIVNYLIQTYGQSKMLALLNTFQQGSTFDNALNKVYGFDMDGLNSRWQASLKPQPKTAEKLLPGSAWLPVAGSIEALLSPAS